MPKLTLYHGSQRANLRQDKDRCIFLTPNKQLALEYSKRELLGGMRKNMKSYIYTFEATINNPLSVDDLIDKDKYGDDALDIAVEDISDYINSWQEEDYDAYILLHLEYVAIPPTNKLKLLNKEEVTTNESLSIAQLNEELSKILEEYTEKEKENHLNEQYK